MIFLNFKNYEESTGEKGLALLKIIEELNSQSEVKIIPVVNALDLKEFKTAFSGEIWVQSVDVFEYGASTGKINAMQVSNIGASGVFVNHSENKFTKDIDEHVAKIKSLGLRSLVFAANTGELTTVLSSNPDFVSYEPPELVGSKDASVSSARPEVISEAASASGAVPLIVGAGVKSEEDVRAAISLGAKGIAVASSVILSVDPRSSLLSLLSGFKLS
jgi:triosephosphate isomerase (TIM)